MHTVLPTEDPKNCGKGFDSSLIILEYEVFDINVMCIYLIWHKLWDTLYLCKEHEILTSVVLKNIQNINEPMIHIVYLCTCHCTFYPSPNL